MAFGRSLELAEIKKPKWRPAKMADPFDRKAARFKKKFLTKKFRNRAWKNCLLGTIRDGTIVPRSVFIQGLNAKIDAMIEGRRPKDGTKNNTISH